MAAAKSGKRRSRTIASPSRVHCDFCSASTTASSESSSDMGGHRTLGDVRIVSLVPSATEMLFAIGAGEEVVAVTHECDWPPEALDLPKVTRDVIGPGLDARSIDEAVRSLTESGQAIYELDEQVLTRLQPDLIVTQSLCAVCAVSVDDVRAVAEQMDPKPEVLSLDPYTLGEARGGLRTPPPHTDHKDEAVDLGQRAAERIGRVRLAVRGAERPRVVALE